MKKSLLFVCLFLVFTSPLAIAVDFEDLSLDPESYWNGSDGSGGFESGGVFFNNNYDDQWDSWDGFAYSNITDTQSRDFTNQYSAITGKGVNGSSNYAVSYIGYDGTTPKVTLPVETSIYGAYITNTTYAYWSMKQGDGFAKQFGGPEGNDPDWFMLTITGKDADGSVTGTVEFYLADFRFEDNSLDYISNKWNWVDLSGLGAVKTLEFALSSSDTGAYGMNTPAYFAMDLLNGLFFPEGSDLDGDGVPDDQEVGDSTDLNEDGTPDWLEDDIKCVNTAVGDWEVGISIEDDPNATRIVELKAKDPLDPDEEIDTTNMPQNMPWGLVQFAIKVENPGDAVTVKIYLSQPVPEGAKWYKYDSTTGDWYEYPHATLIPGTNYVTLDLVDGDKNFGDMNEKTDGIIVDPSGMSAPTLTPFSASPTSAGSGGGGGGSGCFINTAKPDKTSPITGFIFLPWAGLICCGLFLNLFVRR